ncbi:MAG: helix-turn-helix transcriptional regulator [Bacteroidales bacterium]
MIREVFMEFKEKVLVARAKLNFTQEMLAKELNVTNLTVHRWEVGTTRPTKKAELIFDQFCKKNQVEFD